MTGRATMTGNATMTRRATGCLNKSGPRKKGFWPFLLLDCSIWTETMLYDQGISLRRSGYPTCYIRKKIDPRPLGPKKGPKRPFWGPRRKNQNVRLRSHRNCSRFGTNLSVVALFVSELRSFSQWPPARKSPFSPI